MVKKNVIEEIEEVANSLNMQVQNLERLVKTLKKTNTSPPGPQHLERLLHDK